MYTTFMIEGNEVNPETLSIAHAVDNVPTKIASGLPVLSAKEL